MANAKDQSLPSKEAASFRQVVKFYESKQYKKGIKAADQILKKYPEHGETLAMKGLIIGNQDKAGSKAEAYDLVRRGLKANLQSHVCWHVYGLLWRADSNYDEATKCYKNALRIDKENLQILRDLAQLQIQIRDYAGYIDTRRTLLHLKSSNRQNWISLAVAHHLNKEYDTAIKILSGYEGVQEGVAQGEEYEHSEMLLYKALVLEEAGRFEEALKYLASSKEQLKDSLSHQESRARLLVKMNRSGEAANVLRQLLDINPENYRYHSSLRQALGLDHSREWSDRQQTELEALYDDLVQKYPKSTTPSRMRLDFLEGKAFKEAFSTYVQRFLVKGIPSLFSDVKGLYSSSAKSRIIESVFEDILGSLEKDASQLPPADGQKEGQPVGEALLWTRLFLARHYDRLGYTDRALKLVEQCEADSPEVLEVFMVKGIILKHAGDLDGAAAACYQAQSLDQADRYLNGAAAKALFRAGHIERAEQMAWKFINAADPAQTLHDMQCMWYQIECGSAHLQKKDYGRALKNFLAVTKHFATFQEDQFDFHSYCMRKMTLRNYLSMLRMEDTIFQNLNYAKAAFGAVETYLELADKGPLQKQSLQDEENLLASLSLEDRKKHKLKLKKDAQKKAKEEDKRRAAAETAKAREKEKAGGKKAAEKGASKEVDPDPTGSELASTSAPLDEASRLMQSLREHASERLKTHTLGFEVAMRRGKHLLALQAVLRAVSLAGKEHPDVHRMIILLGKEVLDPSSTPQNGHAKEAEVDQKEVVSSMLRSHLNSILGDQSLKAYHQAFAQERNQGLARTAAVAELNILLGLEQKQDALDALLKAAESNTEGPATQEDLDDAIDVHKLLRDRMADSNALESWGARCKDHFPCSRYFEGVKRTPASALDTLYDKAEKAKQNQGKASK